MISNFKGVFWSHTQQLAPRQGGSQRRAPRASTRQSARQSLGRTLREVVIASGFLFLISGYVRGRRFDDLIAALTTACRAKVVGFLSDRWLSHAVANIGMYAVEYGLLSGTFLGLAILITRIPEFEPFLTASHLGALQGRRPCRVDMLLGITLPISCVAAIVSHSYLSLLAVAHFAVALYYVRTVYELKSVRRQLEWHVRIRNPIDSVMQSGDLNVDMDEDDAEPQAPSSES